MVRKSAARDSEEIQKVYLFKGKDDARKHKAVDELVAKVVDPSFADFDLETLEGDNVTADSLIASVTSLPFSSPKRMVVVRFANNIPTAEQDRIAEFIPKMPDSACLAFVVPTPELSDGKPKKGSEVSANLSKAISKVGKVVDFASLKASEAESFVVEEFAQRKRKIERSSANMLVRRVGCDTSVLVTEIEKLTDYTAGSDRITVEDINAVSTQTPEEKVFALVEAIPTKNEAQALQHLGDVFASGGRPDGEAPRVLALIARQLRLLWQYMYLREMGWNPTQSNAPDEIKQALPSEPNILEIAKRQGWMLEKLGRQVRNFTRADLEQGLLLLMATDATLKGIEGNIDDATTAMELLVLKLCRRRAKS